MYLDISNPMAYHAALYVRLSKEDETEGPSQSIINQKSLLMEFAGKHKLAVYDIYVDDGFSGTNFDRPNFNRMIEDIKAQKVNMVITKDLSRLGRDYIMTGHYMERFFPEYRVRYISILDGIDTGVESAANDITPFRAIMNDMYAKDISKKIKSVKHNKQKQGLFIGWKPPYGYKSHPDTTNKFIIDEEAASVVRRMFTMAASDISCRKIAAAFNEEHIPTPATYANINVGVKGSYPGLWASQRISEMLKNEVYLGNMIQNRSQRISYKSKKNISIPEENWVIVPHTHEAIVDEETFQKAALMVSSRRTTRSRKYDCLLKGLLICHECNTPLTIINRPNAAGEDCLFYVCRTYQRFTKARVCTSHCIKEKVITDAVIRKTRQICRDYLEADKAVTGTQKDSERAELQRSIDSDLQSIERRFDAISASLEQMYADRLAGLLDPKDFQRLYSRIKNEQAQLTEKSKSLQLQKNSPAEAEEELKAIAQRFLSEKEINRELLASLITRIELNERKEFRIFFRYKNWTCSDFSGAF